MKSFILSLAFLCAAVGSFSQNRPGSGIRPLTIGDTVPDLVFNNVLNYHSKTARLSDFKGKLVILDFWATWCGSCLNNLGKLDSLQGKLNDKLQVILVNSKNTGDDSTKINDLFRVLRKTTGHSYPFPSLYNDTILSSFFNHQIIPHYVWIFEGTVRAITASYEISEENIVKIISERLNKLEVKKDINTQTPLFINPEVPFSKLEQYSIFLKGQIAGLPSGNRYRKSGSIIHGRAMSNSKLLSMFSNIGQNLIEGFTANRLVLEMNDSADFIFNEKIDSKQEWYKNNLYSYELIVPIKESDKLYRYMLDDLNRYSGYYGTIAKREVLCLILVPGSNFKNKIDDNKNLQYAGIRVHDLINRLNRLKTNHPVLNETGYDKEIHIPLPSISNDWIYVKKELNKYGLDLIEEKREIEMLILTQK